MRVNELMIYKNIEEGEVLQDMAFLMENYDSDFYNQEDLKGLLFDTANQILELAVSMGLREISGILISPSFWPIMRTLTAPPARS